MTTAMEEGALDLSKASRSHSPLVRKEPNHSPVPSLGSDGDGHYTTPNGRNRTISECSDSRDESPPLAGSVRPVPGLMPNSYAQTLSKSSESTGSGSSDSSMPSNLRPFKMYPFEQMPSPSLYGQMHGQMPGMSQSMFPGFPSAGLSPLSPSPASVLDNAISLSSPITQYLQQRKRRMESRMSRDSGAPSEKEPRRDDTPPPAEELMMPPMKQSPGSPSADLRDVSTERKMGIVPEERKDQSYWERRRKNNDAAKRSRDARRVKEEEIALRAAYLEQENLKLRAQVAILKNETTKLHYMLYNRI